MTLLRLATIDDAEALARLQERTFRDTFGASNHAQDMELHCRTHYSTALQEQEIRTPDFITLVCVEPVGLSGFAQLGRGPSPDCLDANQPAEIKRLYVDKEWLGKGLAHQLMEQCLIQARRLGASHIWLGVWENNPRAIRFYQKFGFQEIGAHVFMVGTDAQRDIIMARPIN